MSRWFARTRDAVYHAEVVSDRTRDRRLVERDVGVRGLSKGALGSSTPDERDRWL